MSSALPTRPQACADIALYAAAAAALLGLEKAAEATGVLSIPSAYEGAFTLLGGLVVVVLLLRRRGQRLADLGLRGPERPWIIPVWGIVTIVAHIAAQTLVLAPLAAAFHLPAPDLSRYDILLSSLWIFVPSVLGAMFTGGFIEEVIYRGFFVDRLAILLGDGRRTVWTAGLLSGIPFGLIHFKWGLGGIFATALMGAILGTVFVMARRNLWPVILGHATLDGLLFLSLYFSNSNF